MKVVLFLALVGAAFACDMDAVDTLRNGVATITDLILDSCRPNGQAFSELLRTDSCVAIFNEGKCYYDNALIHYGGDGDVTYGTLKGDVGNLQSLGNTLCGNVEACYTPIKEAVMACHTADAGFKDAVITKVRTYYSLAIESRLSSYAAENDDAVLGTLIQIAMSRFTSLEDIVQMFEDYTRDVDVDADAERIADAFKTAAQGFCDSGCVDSTAHFLKKLFGHMDKAASCPNAITFCGGCANKAAQFMSRKQEIPCCLRSVVDSAITEGNIVRTTYASQIEDIESYVRAEFAGKEDLLRYIDEQMNFVLAQVECLHEVYNNSPNSCTPTAA